MNIPIKRKNIAANTKRRNGWSLWKNFDMQLSSSCPVPEKRRSNHVLISSNIFQGLVFRLLIKKFSILDISNIKSLISFWAYLFWNDHVTIGSDFALFIWMYFMLRNIDKNKTLQSFLRNPFSTLKRPLAHVCLKLLVNYEYSEYQ